MKSTCRTEYIFTFQKLITYTTLLFSLVLALATPLHTISASTLYDYYNTGDDDADGFSGNNWKAQTFTTTDTYTPDYVQLKIYRNGTPSTLTVGIYNTNAGEPTGSALCEGTINGDTLPESAEMVQINLVSCPELSDATLYSIVAHCVANYVVWRFDTSVGYADGDYAYSSDSGSSWDINGNNDFMFEVYGTVSGGSSTPVSANFLEILILIFASFMLCYLIEKGGQFIILRINNFYRNKW